MPFASYYFSFTIPMILYSLYFSIRTKKPLVKGYEALKIRNLLPAFATILQVVCTLFKFQNTHNYCPGLGKLNVLRTCNFRMEIEFRIRYMTKHSHSMKEHKLVGFKTGWKVNGVRSSSGFPFRNTSVPSQ